MLCGSRLTTMWKQIDGYRWPYRINEGGKVQKLDGGVWVDLKPYLAGRNRACVKMRTSDNRKIDVPIVWLMADAFMGGRRPGLCITHKNGSKFNCALWNLEFKSRQECGKLSSGNRRKTVFKIDREGNVVAIYRSAREAAEKEYISQNSISARCLGHVQNPFDLTGYNYQYEDMPRGRKAVHRPVDGKGETLCSRISTTPKQKQMQVSPGPHWSR